MIIAVIKQRKCADVRFAVGFDGSHQLIQRTLHFLIAGRSEKFVRWLKTRIKQTPERRKSRVAFLTDAIFVFAYLHVEVGAQLADGAFSSLKVFVEPVKH